MDQAWITTLCEAFSLFNKSPTTVHEQNLCRVLNDFSDKLAKDKELRCELPTVSPCLWRDLLGTWEVVQPDLMEQSQTRDVTLSLSRFTRNLVAGVPNNQNRAFVTEPKIRDILHYLTSFTQLENKNLYPLTRILVQTLSNIVTLNDELASRLWNLYATLPEDKDILTRLLASPDTRTINATLVLILNSINANGQARSRLASTNCLRIMIRVLDLTEQWAGQEAGSSGDEVFTVSYHLFETFLDQDLAGTLFRAFAIEYEPISPHQTTFLKFIDSYLQHSKSARQNVNSGSQDFTFLPTAFLRLCLYFQHSIKRSLGLESSTENDETNITGEGSLGILQELDLRLPKVSVAVILISQCLTTILLDFQDVGDTGSKGGYRAVLAATLAAGFVENVIETLRLIDRFLPRVVRGQAVPPPGQAGIASPGSADVTGFSYLKRDLVRLLGIICHERMDIQNRIRECDGIHVVLNLCVIDERNPYLQEHALFAMRNILYQNPDNQAVVDALKSVDARRYA